jgi:hypothetical protein
MKKVGNKLKVGRPQTGQTKAKISVSVNEKILNSSLAKWHNQATTSRLVETLLRGYAAGHFAIGEAQ